MKRIYTTIQYVNHRLRSKRWDSFHSPYLFKLFTYCCDERITSPLFEKIEEQREKMKRSAEMIRRADLGVGSVITHNRYEQKVAAIARSALSYPFQCRFLSRLASFKQAGIVLEFGTSLGISAAYLASSNPTGSVVTVEGDPEIAARASEVIAGLGFKNIEIVTSSFETFLLYQMEKLPPIDLFFLDGDHSSEALLRNYELIRPHLHRDAIIVIDDLYWSADMHHGWKQLCEMPAITQSVDCFHFGLLFLSNDFLQKENHIVRLPWRAVFTS